jgi:hypothetical protein
MNIMEKIFGAAKPATQPIPGQMPQQAALPGQPNPTNNLQSPPNTQTQQTAQTAPNGLIPKQEEQPSPMEQFKDLWQPPKTDPNNPSPESNVGFDPQKMMEAAAKVDFSKVIAPEDLQKIAAGGNDAVQAFASALNKTSQQVFVQSTIVTQRLIEKAQADTRAEVMREVSGLIREQNLSDNFANDNPAFQNPALQPVIQALQKQLSEKYPKASTGELQKLAKDYLTGAAELIIPKQQNSGTGQSGKKEASTDWDKYMFGETS